MYITIGQFLQDSIPNYEFTESQIQGFAETPADIGLQPFDVNDEARPYPMLDGDFLKRRDYAESCVYYTVLYLIDGIGSTEKIGDVSYTEASINLTNEDRIRLKERADSLRRKHSLPLDALSLSDNSGIKCGNQYIGVIR